MSHGQIENFAEVIDRLEYMAHKYKELATRLSDAGPVGLQPDEKAMVRWAYMDQLKTTVLIDLAVWYLEGGNADFLFREARDLATQISKLSERLGT